MPTYGATLFKHINSTYDAEDGKVYSIKIRTDLGTKTGLGGGTVNAGRWIGAKRLRKAHFRGKTGLDQLIKRTYPCSNAYWTANVNKSPAAEITMDGVVMVLTGFTGEKKSL
jgi:hypothetical protein